MGVGEGEARGGFVFAAVDLDVIAVLVLEVRGAEGLADEGFMVLLLLGEGHGLPKAKGLLFLGFFLGIVNFFGGFLGFGLLFGLGFFGFARGFFFRLLLRLFGLLGFFFLARLLFGGLFGQPCRFALLP